MIANIPLHTYHKRLKLLRIIISFVIIFFIGSFWYIQIVQEAKYKKLSRHNYLRFVPLKAPRGNIFDRNGVLLASNRASLNVALYRNKLYMPPERLIAISRHLGIKENWLEQVLKRHRQTPPYLPITIKEDATLREVAYLEARKLKIPELLINIEPRRIYLYGESSAHLIGYIGEVSQEQLNSKAFKGIHMGDIIGKSGLENCYDSYIMGKNGWIKQKVDAQGLLAETLIIQNPVPGTDVILTIDIRLQRYVEALMQDMIGAALGIDPNTGEVLFMVSSPSFDPNDFASYFPQKNWRKIARNPTHPLQNRCINGYYPPGSVFKLLIALAALEEGIITPETRFTCNGSISLYGKEFLCHSRGGHGTVDLYKAISRSCNIYFYRVGMMLGIEKIAHYARKFGFGIPTGIDLPFESAGLIPDPQWKKENKGELWYPGETISVAIGQGAVGITPLQLALFTSAIANEGFIFQPRVIKEIRGNSGKVVYRPEQKSTRRLKVNPSNLKAIKQGMWGVINDHGTGWRAYIEDLEAAGKTGTAQLISRRVITNENSLPFALRDHSWFTCFVTFNEPEMVVVVFIEHGGQGGRAAAPLAGQILRGIAALKKGQSLPSLLSLADKSRDKDSDLKGYEVGGARSN